MRFYGNKKSDNFNVCKPVILKKLTRGKLVNLEILRL
jgi:hypothetical protein